VFANHFSGEGLERALDLYRTGFQATETHPEPRTFLTVNVVAAPTAEEAEERAIPQLRMMARLRSNMPLVPLETVEASLAGASDFDGLAQSIMTASRAKWFVGTGADVASELSAFAARYGVEEVMISPIAGAYENEPMDASPGRVQTIELLAAAVAA
jgi:alkanesulfonate monooxygenase SsuD/methylene tetrahydromethanopterin reductase-like flavin-dependent oxidoreductase (luciferase family)